MCARAVGEGGGVQISGFLGQNQFEASELLRARPTCGHECNSESSPMRIWMAIDTNVTAPVNVTGAPVTNTVANHAEKPEKFNGVIRD
ncbi:hypothetical protein Tco_0362652 [Tanacetum coccineum]